MRSSRMSTADLQATFMLGNKYKWMVLHKYRMSLVSQSRLDNNKWSYSHEVEEQRWSHPQPTCARCWIALDHRGPCCLWSHLLANRCPETWCLTASATRARDTGHMTSWWTSAHATSCAPLRCVLFDWTKFTDREWVRLYIMSTLICYGRVRCCDSPF